VIRYIVLGKWFRWNNANNSSGLPNQPQPLLKPRCILGAVEKYEEVQNLQAVLEVCELIKNVTTLYSLTEEDWTDDVMSQVSNFVSTAAIPILVIYYEDDTLRAAFEIPSHPLLDVFYFLRMYEEPVTADSFFDILEFRSIPASIEGMCICIRFTER